MKILYRFATWWGRLRFEWERGERDGYRDADAHANPPVTCGWTNCAKEGKCRGHTASYDNAPPVIGKGGA
jgi:hypothetical protein